MGLSGKATWPSLISYSLAQSMYKEKEVDIFIYCYSNSLLKQEGGKRHAGQRSSTRQDEWISDGPPQVCKLDPQICLLSLWYISCLPAISTTIHWWLLASWLDSVTNGNLSRVINRAFQAGGNLSAMQLFWVILTTYQVLSGQDRIDFQSRFPVSFGWYATASLLRSASFGVPHGRI